VVGGSLQRALAGLCRGGGDGVGDAGVRVSLAKYIKMRAARFSSVLAAACPLEESEKCPCRACYGEGVLVAYTEFGRTRKTDERLKGNDGANIVCIDAMPCPACSGTGVDQEAFLKNVG
jgi:hypothetical protein